MQRWLEEIKEIVLLATTSLTRRGTAKQQHPGDIPDLTSLAAALADDRVSALVVRQCDIGVKGMLKEARMERMKADPAARAGFRLFSDYITYKYLKAELRAEEEERSGLPPRKKELEGKLPAETELRAHFHLFCVSGPSTAKPDATAAASVLVGGGGGSGVSLPVLLAALQSFRDPSCTPEAIQAWLKKTLAEAAAEEAASSGAATAATAAAASAVSAASASAAGRGDDQPAPLPAAATAAAPLSSSPAGKALTAAPPPVAVAASGSKAAGSLPSIGSTITVAEPATGSTTACVKAAPDAPVAAAATKAAPPPAAATATVAAASPPVVAHSAAASALPPPSAAGSAKSAAGSIGSGGGAQSVSPAKVAGRLAAKAVCKRLAVLLTPAEMAELDAGLPAEVRVCSGEEGFAAVQ